MKTKAILKRVLTLLLTLLMLMSSTSLGLSAAQVELADTGYDISSNTNIYYIDTASWNACQMYIWKSDYNTSYTLKKIANTKVYYQDFGGGWGGYEGFKFRSDSNWSKQTSSDIKTNITKHTWFNGTSASTHTNMDGLNGEAKVVNMISTNGGTSYTATANANTYTTVSGYSVSSGATSATSVTSNTKSSSSAAIEAAYGSTITYKATVASNATFKGFSTTNSSTLPSMASTSTSYTRTATGYNTSNNTTVYAYYIVNSDVTATFKNWDGAVLDTDTVQSGSTPTYGGATPTREGYTFTGWEPAIGAITGDTEYIAQFTKNVYTVSVSASPAAGGTVDKSAESVEHGGTVTFTATADTDNRYVLVDWKVNGIKQNKNNATFELTNIVENVEVVAVFEQIPVYTYTVSAGTGGTVTPNGENIVAQGSKVDLTATAAGGYRFTGWTITGNYRIQSGDLSSAAISIIPQADGVTATANFTKEWTVTFVNKDGVELKTVKVLDGADATAPADPVLDHYTFDGWDTVFTNVKSDLTVKPLYTPDNYTVTVNTTTGGTASADVTSVDYPGTVTITATPAAGYSLVNWTISGDYEEVSSTPNSITIRPKANGVTVIPNFALGRKLTVYTYSADNYKNLTLTADTTKVLDNAPQNTNENFNGVTWTNSGQQDIPMTATDVKAQLSGTTSIDVTKPANWFKDAKTFLVADGYRTIVFRNDWNWSDVKLYAWSTTSGGNNGAFPGVSMTKAGTDSGYDVYVMLVDATKYNKIIISGLKDDGSGNRDQSPDTSLPSAPITTYKMTWNNGNVLSSNAISGVTTYNANTSASSEVISLNDQLFANGAWAGETEVWIYQNGSSATVTLRRDILDLIAEKKAIYDAGNDDGRWTPDSWSAFKAAYDAAYTASGKNSSDQDQLDSAEATLRAAVLVAQAYFTVTYNQNMAPYSANIGSTTITTATGTVNVVQNKEVAVKFTAPINHYIVSVLVNGQPVESTSTKEWIFEANITFTQDTSIEIVYEENPELIIQENGATGGTIDFDSNVTFINNKYLISYGFDTTLSVTAPHLYYIQSVYVGGQEVYSGTDETKTSLTGYILENVTSDTLISITYGKRSTLKIEILSYPTVGGTLYYGDTVIPAEGMIIDVLAGESVTITAVPNAHYGIYYWVADTQTDGRENTYTFSAINKSHTLDIEWLQLKEIDVTVTASPNSVGTVTATSGSSTATAGTANNTITVEQYSVITLKATVTDTRYIFTNWQIEGSYYFNNQDDSRSDPEISITASSDIVIKANFTQQYRRIYLENGANWTQPYMHYWGGTEGTNWPGVKMSKDTVSGFWYLDVPMDITDIQFNDGTNQNQIEFHGDNVKNNNLFNNSSNTATDYIEPGYYLQGNWNGKAFSAYDNQKFMYNGDGTYSLTITVDSTTDGYIYVNPTNENSHFWNAATNGATGNPQKLTATGAYQSNPKFVKVEIDTEDFAKSYDVTFTFNPTTGDFSWTKVVNVPTITVIGTDGRGTNTADANMHTNNDRVGDTYFDDETIVSVISNKTYDTANVEAGKPVTFYTQVNKNTNTNGYDYYVAGWVINGTEFVAATSIGNGLYRGSYIFTEDKTSVVPVYFHTNEWLTANSVDTVTVYAVADKDIETWDKYFAAYTWYKVGGVTQYEQFGPWSGQLMIPVAGLDGVYYTIVETSTSNNVPISGITFSNYPSGDNIDNSAIINHTNIQAYDYYEFIALLNDGKHNITFVIKDTNDTYNSNRVNGGTVSITNGNWDFVQYTDYSGLKTDIFGNNIEANDANLNDADALYIIQAGDKSVSNGTLDGQWYVECYLYDYTGKYLGKCYSYELHDEDSTLWTTTLAPYKNQKAYISYEHVNGNRYDGEWYGDANVSVTVNLAVKVALMGADGNYTIDTEGDLNKAAYGEAFINGVQNVDVTRGETVSLSGMPLTGYKFVGWYTADGKLFDKNLASKVTAAIGTYYVAVFEPLAEGSFYVNHYIYTANGTADYKPIAHGGNAQLYVGIQNITQGTTTSLLLGNSAGLEATEGDRLLITIATDGIGADKFYAWYTDAVDKFGYTTFEEVGVDSDDNLAFIDPDSQYYMGVSTVEGSIDRVYFQFEYVVGADDAFVLNFYSDLMPVSDKITLVYQYTDRYGNPKSYSVPYQLTDDEIKGFAGNNNTPFAPAYISSTDGSWVNTVLVNAPHVEDYFKDTTWKITSSMYNTMTFLLWATQPETMYTVTTTVTSATGSGVIVNKVPYNTVIDLDIRDIYPEASYTGFWYQDVNNNGTYEKTVDIILAYGPYYGYRVTQDMAINYEAVDSHDDYEFNVSLDAPVYGREQTTDAEGNNKTDVVIIDYVVNILTPYFYYLHPEFTPIYNGEVITDYWAKTTVTIESLEAAGYDVSYGVILEQVGTYKIKDNYNGDFTLAEADAIKKGYGTATDETLLKNFLASGSTKGWINGNGSTYGTVLDATNHHITNKNRVLFVLEQNNTEANRNKFYNVYGYLIVKAPGADNAEIFISNVQTLNIYAEGTKNAVVDNNTSFA